MRLEGLSKLGKKKIHLIVIRTRDLPACSIVPQPSTLLRAPLVLFEKLIIHGRVQTSSQLVPFQTQANQVHIHSIS
jgi:hypothetical protein